MCISLACAGVTIIGSGQAVAGSGGLVERTCCRDCTMWPLMVASASGQYLLAVACMSPGHVA